MYTDEFILNLPEDELKAAKILTGKFLKTYKGSISPDHYDAVVQAYSILQQHLLNFGYAATEVTMTPSRESNMKRIRDFFL